MAIFFKEALDSVLHTKRAVSPVGIPWIPSFLTNFTLCGPLKYGGVTTHLPSLLCLKRRVEFIVIADKQSHRTVWCRGGGHADQTRQEDHRWVCDSAPLVGGNRCRRLQLWQWCSASRWRGNATALQREDLDLISPKAHGPSLCFPPQTSSLSWRESPTAPSTSTPWWSSSPGAGTRILFYRLVYPHHPHPPLKKKRKPCWILNVDGALLCSELPARWVRAPLQLSTRRCCVRPGARRWGPNVQVKSSRITLECERPEK